MNVLKWLFSVGRVCWSWTEPVSLREVKVFGVAVSLDTEPSVKSVPRVSNNA